MLSIFRGVRSKPISASNTQQLIFFGPFARDTFIRGVRLQFYDAAGTGTGETLSIAMVSRQPLSAADVLNSVLLHPDSLIIVTDTATVPGPVWQEIELGVIVENAAYLGLVIDSTNGGSNLRGVASVVL